MFLSSLVLANPHDRSNEIIVQNIKLVGVKKISKNKINQQLKELKPPVFWKLWANPPKFTTEKLENGLNQVLDLYRQEGYYQTKINPKLKKENGLITITLIIEEGPAITAEDINFNILDAEEDKWKKLFFEIIELQKGKIFRVKEYERAKTNILEYLANSGYPGARLSGEVFIYEKENKANISFTIELGPFTTFGKIEVKGNKKISTKIILREITFTEEEPFSMAKVLESQTKIFRLNFFSSVLINPVNLHEVSGPVDIRILIQERKRRTIETGFGWGTEDKLRFRLSGAYRNFLASASELKLSLKYSSLTDEEALTFRQPYFPNPSTTFIWTISRKKDKFAAFGSINSSHELKFEKTFSPTLSGFLAHRLDSSQIRNLSKETEEKLNFQQENIYFLSYFQAGLKLDTTDSALNPTTGYISSLFVEPSLSAIGSDVSYIKGNLEYKNYFRLRPKLILANRIFLGTIEPYGLNERAVPLFKRFFSGGTYSIRGFGYQKLGPKDQNGEPIGGNSIFESNIEIRFPLPGRFGGIIFLDSGNVSLVSWQFSLNSLRYSTGFGLRYNTIIGDIRLDFGYILNPEDKKIKPYRFHFSLGQTF